MATIKDIPLFRLHTVSEIAEKARYAEGYVVSVKLGRKPLTEEFKFRCALALGKPEAELFTEAVSASGEQP